MCRQIHMLCLNLENKRMPAYAKFPHIYTSSTYIPNPHTDTTVQIPWQTHTHTDTHYSCVILPVPSWTGTNNRGGVNCGILKLTLSVTLCQLCISLYQTHTFAPSLLKQHREQGLWIINTRKVPHNSVHIRQTMLMCRAGEPWKESGWIQDTCSDTNQDWTGWLLGGKMGLQSRRASGLKTSKSLCTHWQLTLLLKVVQLQHKQKKKKVRNTLLVKFDGKL